MTGRIRAVRRLLPANGTGTEPRTDLTGQELKILRKLASPRSLREIGAELYVSHNTVKTHTQSLYRKLGARSRSDAVRIGRDRGLL
ncbi:MAG TPA: LuxR C-terminal-related transcriptional regulator [Microlunatus sp.]|nr:LuxR C-terminal-related transcriptional regulator [Microlunatus sp.]